MHQRNQHWGQNRHQNWTVRNLPKIPIVILILGLAVCSVPAQDAPATDQDSPPSKVSSGGATRHRRKSTLNQGDRQAVIAAALASRKHRYGEHDCSHLVHAIYQRAGFPYTYAPSDDLYDGVQGFQRVSHPQAADLVVWHGHVGIVLRPSQHAFFSFLSAGPGVDDYYSRYWRSRGEARFYRYIKNDPCPGCTLDRGNGE
jgi:NlpC/P60 family